MTLSEADRDRLADVVRLQPTTNGELMDRWDMDSGSEVHAYLEGTLGDYYYRDEDSLIRATPEAAELVDVVPGVEPGESGPGVVRVSPFEARVFEVIAGPEERSQSVVSVLNSLRERTDADPTVDEVREAVAGLRRKRVVETVQRTVPTFRLSVDPEQVDIEEREG